MQGLQEGVRRGDIPFRSRHAFKVWFAVAHWPCPPQLSRHSVATHHGLLRVLARGKAMAIRHVGSCLMVLVCPGLAACEDGVG